MARKFDLIETIAAFLQKNPYRETYWVGFSGGLDSTVLLHALAQLRTSQGFELKAIHINHHLDRNSSAWAEHCLDQCRKLEVSCQVEAVSLDLAAGKGVEAVAREARYRVFRQILRAKAALCLAHHRDDQVETLLLQLLRGAGPAGLSAMPEQAQLADGELIRPLLNIDRFELESWASNNRLVWIEDPSNADQAFNRNYLRHSIVPELRKRWPGLNASFARSSQLCAAANEIVRERAQEDLSLCLAVHRSVLQLTELAQLTLPRQAEALRAWIRQNGFALPDQITIQRILFELIPASEDGEPMVAWEGGEVRRFRDQLWLMPALQRFDSAWRTNWDGQSALALPGNLGQLDTVDAKCGIAQALWQSGQIRVGFRAEGLKCKPFGRDGSKSLKKLFQELAIPPWLRDRVPLIFYTEQLVGVADLALCDAWVDKPGKCIRWHTNSFITSRSLIKWGG